MPTGYTAAIKDGISFKRFVMDCAKAFGACISMRDEPADTPIPDEFVPDSYHTEQLEKAEKDLNEYSNMSIDEAEQRASREYYQRRKEINKNLEENKLLQEKYATMLLRVEAWVPPSAEHIGIKDFMKQQISSSIEHDCMLDYYEKELKNMKKISGVEWKRIKLESIIYDIKYHAQHLEEDKTRAKGRTEWIKALRKSLEEEKE